MSFADSRSFRNLLRLGVRLGIERHGHLFDPLPNPVAPGADSLTCFHQVFCICFAFLHLSAFELKHFSSISSELLSSNDSFSLQRNILRSILSSMSSQDCRFFMEQGNEQCELFQRAHIFVRFKNSSHPINWINLYANDTKHQRYASWTLEQHEGDLAVHNVLEPQSLALGMI